jgi:hypothetical protein
MELKKERGTPKICNVVAMLLVGSLPFSDRLKMQSALIQFVRYVDKQQRCLIRVKDGVEREKKTLSTSQSDLMISGEIELSDDIADLFTAINSAEKLRRTFFSVFSFGASGEKVSVIKNMRDTVQHTHDRIENLSVYSVPIVTSFDFCGSPKQNIRSDFGQSRVHERCAAGTDRIIRGKTYLSAFHIRAPKKSVGGRGFGKSGFMLEHILPN